jgi:class 3 adenylate cyclase
MLTGRRGRARALFIELDRRRGLERFLPPNVVERVLQGDPLRLEGERLTVTILFADLRGSTALAERLAPEQVVAVLNTYLRVMAKSVIDAGGILDKFLGDGPHGDLRRDGRCVAWRRRRDRGGAGHAYASSPRSTWIANGAASR